MDISKALQLRIEELLKKHKMTRDQLAMNSGIPHPTLTNIMQGSVKDSKLSTIILIASGFDMTVSEFLDSPLFNEDNLQL